MTADFEQYAARATDDRRPLFDALHEIITGLCPEALQVIWYRMPTYRVGDGWVALGYWREGVSLYTNSPEHIAPIKAAHPKIKTNKASINFRAGAELPLEAVEQVVRHAMEHPHQPS